MDVRGFLASSRLPRNECGKVIVSAETLRMGATFRVRVRVFTNYLGRNFRVGSTVVVFVPTVCYKGLSIHGLGRNVPFYGPRTMVSCLHVYYLVRLTGPISVSAYTTWGNTSNAIACQVKFSSRFRCGLHVLLYVLRGFFRKYVYHVRVLDLLFR